MNVYITSEHMMLYCEGNCNIFEGNDVIETSTSKECDICHYWYFLDKFLTFNEMYVMSAMMY